MNTLILFAHPNLKVCVCAPSWRGEKRLNIETEKVRKFEPNGSQHAGSLQPNVAISSLAQDLYFHPVLVA